MQNNEYDPKLSPDQVHVTITKLGIKKANTRNWELLLLGLLAGIYISFGAHVYLVALDQGLNKIVGGLVFGVGLVLVVIAGAELFTGNVIMVVGALSTRYSPRLLLRNWGLVYVGNLAGALLFAAAIYFSGLMGNAGSPSSLGQLAIAVAEKKMALPFLQSFVRGILCNILVILAIILSYFSKDVVSKIFCCVLPIMVFVASGFEHCVANMYFLPIGLTIKGVPLAQQWIIFNNLIPVTLGNIVGGIFILVVHPNRIHQLVYLINGKKNARDKTA